MTNTLIRWSMVEFKRSHLTNGIAELVDEGAGLDASGPYDHGTRPGLSLTVAFLQHRHARLRHCLHSRVGHNINVLSPEVSLSVLRDTATQHSVT